MTTEEICELQRQVWRDHEEAERKRRHFEIQQQFFAAGFKAILDQYAFGVLAAFYCSLNPNLRASDNTGSQEEVNDG
jgi:hypothetical protein